MRRGRLPTVALRRRSARIVGLAAIVALSAAPSTAADTLPSGAASCSGCHAPLGPGRSLAGLPAEVIAEAVLAFRDGKREATVMDRIAKGFTDDEIQAIADWLAGDRGAAP